MQSISILRKNIYRELHKIYFGYNYIVEILSPEHFCLFENIN